MRWFEERKLATELTHASPPLRVRGSGTVQRQRQDIPPRPARFHHLDYANRFIVPNSSHQEITKLSREAYFPVFSAMDVSVEFSFHQSNAFAKTPMFGLSCSCAGIAQKMNLTV